MYFKTRKTLLEKGDINSTSNINSTITSLIQTAQNVFFFIRGSPTFVILYSNFIIQNVFCFSREVVYFYHICLPLFRTREEFFIFSLIWQTDKYWLPT